MKSTGIIRKVDDLGRIVLPIESRRTLDIAERDELEIYMENDRIILQKFEPACVFCGSSRSLISYRRKNVCQDCVRKMNDYRYVKNLNGSLPFRFFVIHLAGAPDHRRYFSAGPDLWRSA